ncbi:protein ORF1C [Goose adenovirus 4]|nr:protein ORF1C [Goose adenovirus 4]
MIQSQIWMRVSVFNFQNHHDCIGSTGLLYDFFLLGSLRPIPPTQSI